MDSVDPKIAPIERTPSRKTCQTSPTLGGGKQGIKLDMVMMIIDVFLYIHSIPRSC